MNELSLDELAASRLTSDWVIKYGARMLYIQNDFHKLSKIEQEAYTDLLYKTFPYLSKKNPYQDD